MSNIPNASGGIVAGGPPKMTQQLSSLKMRIKQNSQQSSNQNIKVPEENIILSSGLISQRKLMA